MATDSSAHELRRKKSSATRHEVTARKNRSDSGYSTSSSTSAGSPVATNKFHHAQHSHTHGSSSLSSSSSKRGRARFSVPEDAKGMSKFASLTGFLRKQADNEQGAWNRYYFALRPATYLYYYNSPSDDRPRGIIDLEFLQDIRYNDDCLQRCVGGSEYCFRLSGQMPKSAMKATSAAADHLDKLKLRPMFLDPESPAESKEWMDALKKHRFNVDHAEGFAIMGARIKETELTLKQLGEEAQRVAATAESLRWKGRALLNKLRGITAEPADVETRGSFDVDGNIFSTLQELESLVEDFSAEAAQQARMIETLRARETQQTKLIETLRQNESQQEKKIRELTKFGPPTTSAAESSYHSVISEEELSRIGATKGRSTSNVQELFKKAFLSSKKTADTGGSPTDTLESCIEIPEEEAEAPVKKTGGGGFVDAIKIRVANYTGATGTTTTITQTSTPTSRGSDDTVSISTDDRGSGEVAGDDKLPPDWTKRESRNHPGEFYYVHTSGFTCWDPPSDFLMMGEGEEGGNGEEPEQQPVVLEKNELCSKQPLASLAEVVQAAMEAEAEVAAGSEDDKPTKKSKGWGFLKKLTLGSAALASAQSPKSEPQPIVAVEHEDGRHEF